MAIVYVGEVVKVTLSTVNVLDEVSFLTVISAITKFAIVLSVSKNSSVVV
jgi:hypothetical protein